MGLDYQAFQEFAARIARVTGRSYSESLHLASLVGDCILIEDGEVVAYEDDGTEVARLPMAVLGENEDEEPEEEGESQA